MNVAFSVRRMQTELDMKKEGDNNKYSFLSNLWPEEQKNVVITILVSKPFAVSSGGHRVRT